MWWDGGHTYIQERFCNSQTAPQSGLYLFDPSHLCSLFHTKSVCGSACGSVSSVYPLHTYQHRRIWLSRSIKRNVQGMYKGIRGIVFNIPTQPFHFAIPSHCPDFKFASPTLTDKTFLLVTICLIVVHVLCVLWHR